MTLHIEPHYLPTLEYFAVLRKADAITLDVGSNFQKQTYRNRTYILSANGVQPLIVPVHYKNHMPLKDVKVDYHADWVRTHWGALFSSYGKSPFFDFYQERFKSIWDQRPEFLVDLNYQFIQLIFELLQWDKPVNLSADDRTEWDLRNDILAKKSYESRNFYRSFSYFQNFGNTFVPNLSILDLLMNQGPDSDRIIAESTIA